MGASAETCFVVGVGCMGMGRVFSEHFLWRLGVFKDDTPVGNSYFV